LFSKKKLLLKELYLLYCVIYNDWHSLSKFILFCYSVSWFE